MIVVRSIFDVHFGQMADAKKAALEVRGVADRLDHPAARVLTDVTGEFYTLVLKSEFEDLADFERRLQRVFQDPEWQAWYRRFSGFVRSGRREIFRVVE